LAQAKCHDCSKRGNIDRRTQYDGQSGSIINARQQRVNIRQFRSHPAIIDRERISNPRDFDPVELANPI
jgi:hypothetical protein